MQSNENDCQRLSGPLSEFNCFCKPLITLNWALKARVYARNRWPSEKKNQAWKWGIWIKNKIEVAEMKNRESKEVE